MRKFVGTPELVIAGTLAALVAFGIAFGGSSGHSKSPAEKVAAQVRVIATRVEAIRGLSFKRLPKPVIVSPQETQREALADLDRSPAKRATAADEQVLELLGLIPPGTDLRKVETAVSGQEVVGFYDSRRKRLAIVSGAGLSDEVSTEITLAHELDHALDDQRFGIRDVTGPGADDEASAYTALIEGVATAVMQDYSRRFVDPIAAFGSALSGLGAAANSTRSIPPYVQHSLEFSYVAGDEFVTALYDVAHDWRLVNAALAGHPPRSTEQVMHPAKYLTGEKRIPVAVPDLRPLLGAGWRKQTAGTLGEFDTGQLLELGVSKDDAARAAAGWGGGTYALWSDPAEAISCAVPCRRSNALVLDWRWDTPRDAAEFLPAVRAYVTKGLHGAPAGRDAWTVAGGGAALATGPRATALVLGPSPSVSARLASRLIPPGGG